MSNLWCEFCKERSFCKKWSEYVGGFNINVGVKKQVEKEFNEEIPQSGCTQLVVYTCEGCNSEVAFHETYINGKLVRKLCDEDF